MYTSKKQKKGGNDATLFNSTGCSLPWYPYACCRIISTSSDLLTSQKEHKKNDHRKDKAMPHNKTSHGSVHVYHCTEYKKINAAK